uniref:Hyaluronan-binding protein 4 n=1 Tax=Xenopus tropicalis TaxID=8364 RepID=A0A803JZN8_XENTR
MRLDTMKQAPSSPDNVAMQDNFGCAVENRFNQLLDDESDPLDFLYQSGVEITRRKKKEEAAAKKSANQKSGKKESQKERKAFLAGGSTEVQGTQQTGQKHAPKNTVKATQNENVGSQVKVDRAERRTAFKEVRPNIMDRATEYSIENRIRPEDKRGGGGPRNWGSIKEAFSEIEAVPVEEQVEPTETTEATEEEHGKVPEEINEGFSQEMSLDEWKSLQDQNRAKTEFNLRKPETSVPSKAVVIHKSKYKNNISENEEEYHYCFRKPVNDITARLDINFGSLARPSRGRGAGGRGRVRREEAFPHEVVNVLSDAPNPDDPEDFPALV